MEHLLQLYVIFYYLMRTTYKNELISRDSKGKIRVVYASAKYLPIPNEFRIFKKTGLFKGKLIEQPEKVITEGKAKRTVHQQGDLEYNSTIPRLLNVTALINAQVITTQSQIITARFMYYNKASNTTTEVARSAKSTTLSGTGDSDELVIATKIRFSRFDRIWVEVKNDNATRTFRILDSTIII